MPEVDLIDVLDDDVLVDVEVDAAVEVEIEVEIEVVNVENATEAAEEVTAAEPVDEVAAAEPPPAVVQWCLWALRLGRAVSSASDLVAVMADRLRGAARAPCREA